MSIRPEKHPYLYSQYTISHGVHQMITTSNSNNNRLWSRMTSWIRPTVSIHQIDSSLITNDPTSELTPLACKSTSSSSLTISQLSSTTSTLSLRVKIFSYFLFFLFFIAVIIFAYQTGFYLVLLRNLQSTSPSSSSLFCKNDYQHISEKQNSSHSVDFSYFLALQTVLQDVEYAPSFPVDLLLNTTDLTNKSSIVPDKCSHYSCFDIYRCGIANYQPLELLQLQSKNNVNSQRWKNDHHRKHLYHHYQLSSHPYHKQHIKVYVYPHYRYVNKETSDDVLPLDKQQQSAEFTRLIKAVVGSRYYTASAAKTCLFVVNLDLLNVAENVEDLKTVEKILWSLPSFAALSGANHLLFSMLLPSNLQFASSSHVHPQLGINIGQAMVAAAGFRLSTYRDQFDVALPGYSLFGQLYSSDVTHQKLVQFKPTAISSLLRRWTLISPQAHFLSAGSSESLKSRLQQLEVTNPDEILLLQSDCNIHSEESVNADPQVKRLFAHFDQQGNSNNNETNFSTFNTAYQLYTGAKLCNPERKIRSLYLDLLHNSEFCLIVDSLSSSSSWSLLLSDALMSGCIPVLLADNLVLPFEAPLRIDWATASIRVWEHSASRLLDILNSVSVKRRSQLRANGLAIWQTYFSSIETIATTTLDLINERVYPAPRAVFAPVSNRVEGNTDQNSLNIETKNQQQQKPYRQFRQQSFNFFSTGGYHYIVGQEAALRSVGFTAVILSYNRPDSLMDVILSVSRAPSCAKILVIWNGNADLLKSSSSTGQSSPLRWPPLKGGTPIQVVVVGSNRLSNRFYPYESIETEAVFSIDDDIGMLTADEIEFAYQTWRQFPDRIVGFPSRRHFWANRTSFGGIIGHNRWTYDSEWRNEISLILTGAAFYHSYYNHLYTNVMPVSIREWVDRMMNCEDIAMNFLVSNITCAAPIKVTPRKKFKCPECSKPSPKLSADAVAHLKMRSRCIDYFAQVYGMMPLKAVEFRANPVLFRDNIPEKLKAFTMIGTL